MLHGGRKHGAANQRVIDENRRLHSLTPVQSGVSELGLSPRKKSQVDWRNQAICTTLRFFFASLKLIVSEMV